MPMPEPGQEPQFIVATPEDYALVITVDLNGLADMRTSLPLGTVIKFLRQYAHDLESGNYGPGAVGGQPGQDGPGQEGGR
jgi:hypothetical protein